MSTIKTDQHDELVDEGGNVASNNNPAILPQDETVKPTKSDVIDDPQDSLLHAATNHGVTLPTKLEHTVASVINEPAQELLGHAAVQHHQPDHAVNGEEEGLIAAAPEIVVNANPNPPSVVIPGADPGSILPSDLSAEVAASAAAVAASLNHQHNDLLLSNEIAQIAAESAAESAAAATEISHEQHLASRRQKDRERYASMTQEQRESYNKKRREQYHRQSEDSRRKRRERERSRYHSLSPDRAKGKFSWRKPWDESNPPFYNLFGIHKFSIGLHTAVHLLIPNIERNARRAELERERYKKLSPTELAARNAKRRERAAMLRAQKKAAQQGIILETHATEAPIATAPAAVTTQTSTTELDMVRVYDVGMNPEVNYETQNEAQKPTGESTQVQQAPSINLQADPSMPNVDEPDESVPV